MTSLPSEFLTSITNHFESSGHSDVKIKTEPGSSKGDNYMGVITKATIEAKNTEGKVVNFNWIIKSASDDIKYREVMLSKNVFVRETYMYENVFPAFAKLQEDLNVNNPFKNVAKAYLSYAEIPECLAMENMKELGYVMKNRKEPLDYKHTMQVMKAYGRYHALSFALKEKNPECFAELGKNLQENFWRNITFDSTGPTNDKLLKSLTNKVSDDILQRFENYSENIVKKIIHNYDELKEGTHSIIGHGDSWVNNMLFKYENDKDLTTPTDICLLDFQLSCISSPAVDLSYYIFTCTSKELRDAHYDDMLKTYHDSLTGFLKELSCDTEVFPFEILLEHLKKYAIYGLLMTTLVTHLMLSDVEEIPDMTVENFENPDAMLADIANEEKYIDRMKAVVTDFANKNYI